MCGNRRSGIEKRNALLKSTFRFYRLIQKILRLLQNNFFRFNVLALHDI